MMRCQSKVEHVLTKLLDLFFGENGEKRKRSLILMILPIGSNLLCQN